MQTTMSPGQTTFGEDLGTIVHTVTPIVASILQGRSQPWSGSQQPYGGVPGGLQGGMGFGQQMPLPFAQQLQPHEIAQIATTVTPIVLSLLQSRQHPGFGGGQQSSPWLGQQAGFGGQQHLGGQGMPWGGSWQPGGGYGQGGYGQGGPGFGQSGFGYGQGTQPSLALQPNEIAQLVSVITPLVASIVQSRNVQMQMGQGLPRAA